MLATAQQHATDDRNGALGAAAELVDQARSEGVLFDADRTAQERDGEAFLLERWFERLVDGLSQSEVIVIDHRLNGQNAPTIDLRSFDAGTRDVAAPSPRTSEPRDDDDNEFTSPKSPARSRPKR
jgi:hypothetical protein